MRKNLPTSPTKKKRVSTTPRAARSQRMAPSSPSFRELGAERPSRGWGRMKGSGWHIGDWPAVESRTINRGLEDQPKFIPRTIGSRFALGVEWGGSCKVIRNSREQMEIRT